MAEERKKYVCLVCGAIIDNPDFCEFCGATSESIVPYDGDEDFWEQ